MGALRLLAWAALVAGVLGTPAPAAAQCAMCRTALTNSAEGQAAAASFNKAILVMLAAPYLVAGGVGAALYRRRIGQALRGLIARRH